MQTIGPSAEFAELEQHVSVETLLHWLDQHGVVVVFLNVLVEQLGFPIPAYPVLLIAGAFSVGGRYHPMALLAVSVLGCLIADLLWYTAGRRWGARVLRTVCRVSLSPDSCVRQTESLFDRWGAASLVVAKFIPGFATIAATLSGNRGIPIHKFVLLDAIGASLYAGLGIAMGFVFHEAVGDVVGTLENLGRVGVALVAALLALFVTAKWWQRYRLIRELRASRITVEELTALLAGDNAPVVLDVRTASSRVRDGAIPGAIEWSLHDDETHRTAALRDGEVVVYCACPNEASAALVAQKLRRAGFSRVRPLAGGIDAWIAAGLPIERPASNSP